MANTEANFPFGLCKNDAHFLKHFNSTLKELRTLVLSNIEYYQRGKSSIHSCFYSASCILLERTQALEPQIFEIAPKLQDYDLCEEVQANGYRSFVSIVNRCCIHLLQLCRHINVNKTSLLFRSSFYLKELEAYVETLGQLMAFLGYLEQLMSYTRDGNLFVDGDQEVGDDLLLEVEMVNTDCFYGRCIGFHFHDSIRKTVKAVNVIMATYSECYGEKSQMVQLASSLLNSGKYYLDDHLRAKQVVDFTRTCDIKFCKDFWSITESPVLHHLRSFTFPHIQLSEVMSLCAETFELPRIGHPDDTVTITPPCAHTGPAPVQVRLISHALREGMVEVGRQRFRPKTGSSKKPEVLERSPGLLFHVHGGGFVALSSQSHENYLRLWAQKLEMPILSVDYSLAPEQPFPRALEECFYAYAWALKNPEKLGWTGERVCFVGDSAGGNILLSTALRAVSYEIQVPDGLVTAYATTLVQYTPSPARLMSMIDPILPVGILTRCLAAYAGIADKFSSALAQPIFCNPGKYETWEVVEQDVEINIQNEVANQNTDNKCVTNENGDHVFESSNEEGCDVDSKSGCLCTPNVSPVKADSCNESGIVNSSKDLNSMNKCNSIENMSEDDYLVYELGDENMAKLGNTVRLDKSEKGKNADLNEFHANSDAHIDVLSSDTEREGKRSVMDEDCDRQRATRSGSDDSEVIRHRLADAMRENSRTTSEESLGARAMTPQSNGLDLQSNYDHTNSGNQYTNIEVKPSIDITDGCDLDIQDVSIPGCESVEAMLSMLDSNVTIKVDPGDCIAMDVDGDKPSALGAVCEELLYAGDATDQAGMSVDMMSSSCHSLEDLVQDTPASIENQNFTFDCTDGASSNRSEVVSNACELSGLAKCKDIRSGCLDIDKKVDSGNIENDRKNHSLRLPEFCKSPSCPESFLSKTEDSSTYHGQLSEGSSKEASLASQTPVNHTGHRRHMSLDLPVNYHPGQSALSPQGQGHDSPLQGISPTLSPGSRTFRPKLFSVQRKIAQSPIKLFRQLPIVKNFYMSPLLAPDDLMKALPEVHMVACHFDPLLDDSVMFAKRLRRLGKPVTLRVYDNLPHGFLNFYDASKEAMIATENCVESFKHFLEKKTY